MLKVGNRVVACFGMDFVPGDACGTILEVGEGTYTIEWDERERYPTCTVSDCNVLCNRCEGLDSIVIGTSCECCFDYEPCPECQE